MTQFVDKRDVLARDITAGSVSPEDAGEYDKAIAMSPQDGALRLSYGDFLCRTNADETAAEVYDGAVQAFLASKNSSGAVAAKLAKWRNRKPHVDEIEQFHQALQKSCAEGSPLASLLSELEADEAAAFMEKLARVRLPEGRLVRRCGQLDTGIYFVVSGKLSETASTREDGGAEAHMGSGSGLGSGALAEDDCFGEIWPLDVRVPSDSDVVTCSPVELLKLSKPKLAAISQPGSRLERLMEKFVQRYSRSRGFKVSASAGESGCGSGDGAQEDDGGEQALIWDLWESLVRT